MTTELDTLLAWIGYDARPEQTKLYELLTSVADDRERYELRDGFGSLIRQVDSNPGVIVQAGTGVGKSIAVLAAAAHAWHRDGVQSLIVTPTRVLMDQYMAGDAQATAEAFGLDVAELRGRRWYHCAKSMDMTTEEDPGCMGRDVGCSLSEWRRGQDLDPDYDGDPVKPYDCGYQQAKHEASEAAIVVTNTDFWIINDRLLAGMDATVFDPTGSVFVDEGHQLEQKLRDYAAKSIQTKELERYGDAPGAKLARVLASRRDSEPAKLSDKILPLIEAITARGPWTTADGKTTERSEEVHAGLIAIAGRLREPSPAAIVWTDGWALKLDWVDVSKSAGSLLEARPFGIVSATIPSSMPAALGVPRTPVHDVGHPFDYAKQAELRISRLSGSWSASQDSDNFVRRAAQLQNAVLEARGGALLLFSSFADMKRVYTHVQATLRGAGRRVLVQGADDSVTNAELAAAFKADGNAVLFGSESFATGFDVPGDALKLVVIWKLPYPGKDPVTEALREASYPRYHDLMLTRVTQAAGRLIRTTTDTGRLVILDSRAQSLLSSKDMMTEHLRQFRRV